MEWQKPERVRKSRENNSQRFMLDVTRMKVLIGAEKLKHRKRCSKSSIGYLAYKGTRGAHGHRAHGKTES